MRKLPLYTLTLAVGIFVSPSLLLAESGTLKMSWETSAELKQPESAIYDAKRNVLYVSNINGKGTEANNLGFLSQVSLDGKIEQLEWIKGLNAPKGMALRGDKLYVSDIKELVEIDIEKGAISKRYPAAGAVFLNDVAVADDGTVYVSDMMTDTIHRLQNGSLTAWLKSSALQSPNGLHVEGDRMIVGAWGIRSEGFKTQIPGHLRLVSIKDRSIKSLGHGKPVGNLDGVEADGKGNYYVTDWTAGKLFHITPSGDAKILLELEPGSADHEFVAERNLIVIPMMKNNKVMAFTVE